MQILFIYLFIINAVGYLFMITDKAKAKKGARRTPEAALMFVAAIGGSLGSLLGMYTVRHKTRHKKFTFGIPALLILHLLVLYILVVY